MNLDSIKNLLQIANISGFDIDSIKLDDYLIKPNYLLSSKDKWKLISLLLSYFGANFHIKNSELILYWGVEDLNHFKFILFLINSITGSNSKGEYIRSEGYWKIQFG